MMTTKNILLCFVLTSLLRFCLASTENVDSKMQSNLRITRREKSSIMSMLQVPGQRATTNASRSTRGKDDSRPPSENTARVRGMSMTDSQREGSIKMRRSNISGSNMGMISLSMTMIDGSRKVTSTQRRRLEFHKLLNKRKNNNKSKDGRAGFGFFDGKKKDKSETADDDCLVSKAARNGRYNFFSDDDKKGRGSKVASSSRSGRSKSKSKSKSRLSSRSGRSKSKSKSKGRSSSKDFFCGSARNSRHQRLRHYVGDLDRTVDTYFRSRNSELASADIPLQWPHHKHPKGHRTRH